MLLWFLQWVTFYNFLISYRHNKNLDASQYVEQTSNPIQQQRPQILILLRTYSLTSVQIPPRQHLWMPYPSQAQWPHPNHNLNFNCPINPSPRPGAQPDKRHQLCGSIGNSDDEGGHVESRQCSRTEESCYGRAEAV